MKNPLKNIHLTAAEKVEIKRDLTVFVTALASTGVVVDLIHGTVDRASLVAAIVVAAKVTARKVFPQVVDAVEKAVAPAPAPASAPAAPAAPGLGDVAPGESEAGA